MHLRAIAINDLQPIAARMRSREEDITSKKSDLFGLLGELTALAVEQGQDVILARTKLNNVLRWSEWLQAHVPNLPEQQAAKYVRLATEQLRHPREVVFAFVPQVEAEQKEQRTSPKPWEMVWGYIHKLKTKLKDEPMRDWPAAQRDLTRTELEPIAKELWPENFNVANSL